MKVVFDTNIVASACFWRGTPFDCLVAWAQGRCDAVVSPEVLAEYHEVLEELRLEYPNRKPVQWADALAGSALLVFPSERATGATTDPDDEMILECALGAEADYIITGDKKHLLPLVEFHGTRIITATDFLGLVAG
ncbi:MAG: putative toxin-antitoxin system toxin component, PIN family [Verrucomicrobiota bacterium]